MAEPKKGNGTYQLITPPNLLKDKVRKTDGPGIDPELLKRAEAAVDGLKDEFEAQVLAEAGRINELAQSLADDRSKAEEVSRQVYLIGHEVAGQGATYGYDLVTQIGNSLCRYIDRLGWPGETSDEVLRAHADAIRAVVGNKVNGTGGAVGESLVAGLNELVDRMSG